MTPDRLPENHDGERLLAGGWYSTEALAALLTVDAAPVTAPTETLPVGVPLAADIESRPGGRVAWSPPQDHPDTPRRSTRAKKPADLGFRRSSGFVRSVGTTGFEPATP
jgi:hypothetical protein